jgi:hypothetical protein
MRLAILTNQVDIINEHYKKPKSSTDRIRMDINANMGHPNQDCLEKYRKPLAVDPPPLLAKATDTLSVWWTK